MKSGHGDQLDLATSTVLPKATYFSDYIRSRIIFKRLDC